MKRLICILAFIIPGYFASAQPDTTYPNGISRATALYLNGQYLQSAKTYNALFRSYGQGFNDDRYTAACSWTLAGYKDSAFILLNHIASKGNFRDIDRLLIDDDLEKLHTDPRWKKLVARIKMNKTRTAAERHK